MSRRSAVTAALAATILAATQVAAAASSDGGQRLPRVTAGLLLPDAGGLVLGKTTKPQLLVRWGRATQCTALTHACTWSAGIARDGSRLPGVTADTVTVGFLPTAGWGQSVALTTSSARTSRLRGWRLPAGVGIGSVYASVRRAFPTLRFGNSGAIGESKWLVSSYQHAGRQYSLAFVFDRGTKQIASGRVTGVTVALLPPRFTCNLVSEPVAPPAGAAAGRRVRGSCTGASIHAQFRGGPSVLDVELEASGGQVTGVTSPFDPNCVGTTCRARSVDWAIDVTVGLSTAGARLEARVGPPSTSSQVLTIALG